MNQKMKKTNITISSKNNPLSDDGKLFLLQQRRQIRFHYDKFKNGNISKEEYLTSIRTLDQNIDRLEMSVFR